MEAAAKGSRLLIICFMVSVALSNLSHGEARCVNGGFECDSGQCTTLSSDRCDGIKDCSDGSDESVKTCFSTASLHQKLRQLRQSNPSISTSESSGSSVAVIVGVAVGVIMLLVVCCPIIIIIIVVCCIFGFAASQSTSSRHRSHVQTTTVAAPATVQTVTTASQPGAYPEISQYPATSAPYPATVTYPDPVDPQLTQEAPPPYPGTEQPNSEFAYPPVSYPPPQA